MCKTLKGTVVTVPFVNDGTFRESGIVSPSFFNNGTTTVKVGDYSIAPGAPALVFDFNNYVLDQDFKIQFEKSDDTGNNLVVSYLVPSVESSPHNCGVCN